MKRVTVLDYGSGNLRSAVRALERAGAEVTLSTARADAQDCDGLVVPGVGAYAACMAGLKGVARRHDHRPSAGRGRPVLGICVGMQILFERGVEHGVETEGCGEWPGTVERLQAPVVPHMGWNTVQVPEGSTLFAGIEDERFYFVHSYAARRWELETHGRTHPPEVTWAEHGGDRFVAAVENGPLTRDPVPPREVGRRRSGAAPELGGVAPDEQGTRAAPRRARARAGDQGRSPGGRGGAPAAPRRPAARGHRMGAATAGGGRGCWPPGAAARSAPPSPSCSRSTCCSGWCATTRPPGRSGSPSACWPHPCCTSCCSAVAETRPR